MLVDLRSVANVFSNTRTIADTIKEGKYESSLSEISLVVHSACRAQVEHPKFVELRSAFADAITICKGAWRTAFDAAVAVIKDFGVLDAYKAGFGSVIGAVASWDSTDHSWISEGSMGPEDTALGANTE